MHIGVAEAKMVPDLMDQDMADQRVQPDGDRGVGVGRHASIVSVVRGKGRRDTMSNLYR